MDGENSKREVMAVVRRRRWPFFTALFVGLALASAASMAVPKSYKCVTRIEVSANHAIPAPEFASKVDAVAKQMLSTESMERVAEELGLAGPGGSGTAEAARDILAGTRVEQEAATDGTCVIKVEHSSRDPQACFKVLSQLVGVYRQDLYDRPRVLAQQAADGAKKSVETIEGRVAAARTALDTFQTENADFLGELDRQLAEVQSELQSIEERDFVQCRENIKAAEDVLKTEPKNREQKTKKIDTARLASIEGDLNQWNGRLEELTSSKKYADDHPEVVQARAAVKQLEKQKTELEQNAEIVVTLAPSQIWLDHAKMLSDAKSALSVAEMRAAGLRKNERLLQDKQRSAPPIRAQRDKLAAELADATKLLGERTAELTQATERLRTVADERQLNFKTLAEPAPPRSPAGAPPAVFALGGLVVGAAAGLGLAWILDAQDRSFRDAGAVAGFLGVAALGGIGKIETPAETAVVRGKTLRTAGAVAALGFVAVVLAGAAVWSGSRDVSVPGVDDGSGR